MTNTKTLTAADLDQFTGTENYYKHWTGRLLYTDGVQHVAAAGGAFWLIDAIASYQHTKKLQTQGFKEFQLWQLKRNGTGATLTCRADTDEKPVVTQKIPFTDFPLDEITLYVEGGVLLLPSEH